MGTSSLYKGPGNHPLLPSDYEDIGDNIPNNEDLPKSEDVNPETPNPLPGHLPYKTWSDARKSLRRYASGGSLYGIKKPMSDYIKANRGSQNAVKSSKSAIRTTSKIISFFGGIIDNGARAALHKLDITFEGRSTLDIFNDIVNEIAPIPIDREDSISRKALIDALGEIYSDESFDVESLDSFDIAALNKLVATYVYRYIYAKIINDLGSAILKCKNPSAVETDIKEYIKGVVNNTFRNYISSQNIQSEIMQERISKLYENCYQVMEDQL